MAHKSSCVQRLMGKAKKKNRNGAPVAQQEHTERQERQEKREEKTKTTTFTVCRDATDVFLLIFGEVINKKRKEKEKTTSRLLLVIFSFL